MKILQNVPEVIFQKGCFADLTSILAYVEKKHRLKRPVFLVDHVFKNKVSLPSPIPRSSSEMILWVDTDKEPTTKQADDFTKIMKELNPDYIVGIGGGSVLDITKGVSVLLNNPGSCSDYQGWDKVKNRALFKIGIPTLSGTGSEVSRTCIFTSPTKKQGINDDHTRFDMVILDPTLTCTVPAAQKFFTAMDCYIHSVESLRGTMINPFSRGYAEKALELCVRYFLDRPDDGDLMTASYFGGCSIVYSEVGICHALSYGISFILGYHHGEANSIVFDYLDDYYPEDVKVFRKMLSTHNIELPRNIMKGVSASDIDKMIELTYLMEKPLTNALGQDWKLKLTPEKIKKIYSRM